MADFQLGEQWGATATLPPWDGTGIPFPVSGDGWPVLPDGIHLSVPSTIYTPVGTYTLYTTHLVNYGAEVPAAETHLRFEWEDGTPMVLADLEYANEDSGIPTILTLTEVSGGLEATSDPYPIPAVLDAAARVRIKVTKPGNIIGVSTIQTDTGDPLTTATYTYVVTTAAVSTGDVVEEEPDGGLPGDPLPDGEDGIPLIPVDEDVADEGYDPSEHTVVEVQAYLDENPDQTDYVLDRERAGKNRTTLTGG